MARESRFNSNMNYMRAHSVISRYKMEKKATLTTPKLLRMILCLRDLGYFSQENLSAIAEKDGFFVSRIRNNTNLYQQNNNGKWEKINLDRIMETLKPGEVTKLSQVRVGAKSKEPLCVRIVVAELTEEQKEKRKEHLGQKKKRRKSTLSAQRNILCNVKS